MEKADTEKEGTPSPEGLDLNEVARELGIPAAAAEAEKEPTEEADDDGEKPKEETPEGEETEETTEETTEEAGEKSGEDEEEGEKPEVSENVQRRIDRLTAKRRELEETLEGVTAERDDLRKQVEAKAAVVTVDAENPLSSLTTMEALQEEERRTQAVLDWTEEHEDGGNVTVAGEEKFYDKAAVKQIRRNALDRMRAVPGQKEYLQQRSAVLPEAQAVYPDFFKKGTTAHQFLEATVKQYPFITRIPAWELVVGDAFVGQSMRLAKAEAMQQRKASSPKEKADPAAEKVAKSPTPTARPKVDGGAEARLRQKSEKLFKSGGNPEALEEYLEEVV